MKDNVDELAHHIVRHAIKRGDFTLASGRKSTFYLDLKQVTMHQQSITEIGERIVRDHLFHLPHIRVVAGPMSGADPIVSAVLTANERLKEVEPLTGLLIRKEPKDHGTGRLLEGPALAPGVHVLMVEDVATTGGSMLKAIKAVREMGGVVTQAVVVVDRDEGAAVALEAEGVELRSLFTIGGLARIVS